MAEEQLSVEASKKLASSLFNRTWELIDLTDRSPEQELEMIHSAHASRLHWQVAGGPEQWAIGEWQCARVYCEVGFPEQGIFHAQACLELVENNAVPVWLMASAFEVLSRSYWGAGDLDLAKLARGRARQLIAKIEDAGERESLEAQVAELKF
ncbi:MAG: hypothetical protein RIR46_4 [Actinomycetota bacterium]|jgi:hypothetical protein